MAPVIAAATPSGVLNLLHLSLWFATTKGNQIKAGIAVVSFIFSIVIRRGYNSLLNRFNNVFSLYIRVQVPRPQVGKLFFFQNKIPKASYLFIVEVGIIAIMQSLKLDCFDFDFIYLYFRGKEMSHSNPIQT